MDDDILANDKCQRITAQPNPRDRADDVVCSRPAVNDVAVAFNGLKYVVPLCDDHMTDHHKAGAARRQRLKDANAETAARRQRVARGDQHPQSV